MCINPQRHKLVAFVLLKEKSGFISPWSLMLELQYIDLQLFCRGVPLLNRLHTRGTLLTNQLILTLLYPVALYNKV